MNTEQVFQAIHDRALPMMECYKSDLVHDQRCMYRNPGEPFLHGTRITGTTLIMLARPDSEYWPSPGEKVRYLFWFADREHILDQVMPTAKHITEGEEHLLFQYFDGKRVIEVPRERVQDICQDYVLRIRRAWRKEAHRKSCPL